MSNTAFKKDNCREPIQKYLEVQDEIDIGEVFQILWKKKWHIVFSSLFVSLLAFLVVYRMPNIYRSEAVLLPAEDAIGNGLGALAGQLGGIASLVGAGLDKNTIPGRAVVAVEVLKSRKFIGDFIVNRKILIPLMAAQGWDSESKQLVLNPSIYDEVNNKWIGKDGRFDASAPSEGDAYFEFSKRLQVSQSKDTGMVRISFEFFSPEIARDWVSWIIEDINNQMRERDIKESEHSIEYLNEKISQTASAELKQILYQLIEKQMQKAVLANIRPEYVFGVVDPPIVPEKEVAPRRAMVLVLTFFLWIGAYSITLIFISAISNRSTNAANRGQGEGVDGLSFDRDL